MGAAMTVRALYDARVADGTITADPAQSEAVEELDRIARELARPVRRGLFSRRPDPVKGLYLWGGVGRGKSMLMDLAVEAIEVPARRAHFHAFMQWVHDRMAAARARGVDDAILPVAEEIAAEVRLLAFDEMQITDIADAMIVGRLFGGLFERGVTLITTSNRPPDDLYKNGLNRPLFEPFIDLIKRHCVVHELASPTDYRLGRMSGRQTYFTPNDRAAREALDRIWADLTGGADPTPLVLRVKGREVEIPAFHNGVARARFHDLCGRPLGAADYLALAGAARVLILDDIPQLGSENFNEARRFVTLIDALYEARVQLVASAAARPEMLYVEGEGTFEFERTVSRLLEMQSDDWAA